MRTLLKLSIAAAALSASVAANAELLYGVSLGNQLVTFDSASPNTIISSLFLSGRASGANVSGIDFRPSTGQLYVLTDDSNLYTANLSTGALTSVGALSTPLNGVTFGFDFNPTVDRIRVTSSTGQNLNVDPANGNAIVQGSFTSGTNIAAVAYSNNVRGATTTTLYGIDGQSNNLVTIVPATGATTTVGPIGFNITSQNGFDISGSTGIAYAGLQTLGGSGTSLYTINLATGTATSLGIIGSGSTSAELRALSAAPAPVPEPASIAAIGVGLVALARRRKAKKA